METRKDQAEGRKDKGACLRGVDQMKTTGLADGEVHHITELTSRTLNTSTAGPPGCHSRPMLLASYHTWIQATRFILELIPAATPGPRY